MSESTIDELVDIARYPLNNPESDAWRSAVNAARRGLVDLGCSVLPGFIRADLLETLRAECAEIAPSAYYTVETVNAYNIDVADDLPEDHPGRMTMERGNAFVARDKIPPHAIIQRLYAHSAFQRFLAECFGLAGLYELGDPLAGLCLNVITPGREHPWHFDTNEFTVSMVTQSPDRGGEFQYCPNIRTPERENLPDVRDVLTGDGARLIRELTLEPGDLQLFKGRFSLHRVRSVGGTADRYSVIFAYSERPGVIGSPARTRQLFGRVLPEHLAAAGRVRGDALLD